jgi:DNA-binding transcriptional LysR family regulator
MNREVHSMEIETRLLRYFVAVAEERHFAEAAERLGITPPTLTHQIQKLERHLGVRLLLRKGNRKVVLTAAGQRFLPSARETLRELEEGAVVARQAARGELGCLQVGFVTLLADAGLLGDWIDAFRQAHPAIDISLRKATPMAQIDGIKRKELDAGFTRTPNEYPSGVRGFEIYRQRLVLALPRKHPLARRRHISAAMLAREAFVSFPPELDVGFFGFTEAIARIGNFTPHVVKREDDFTVVLAYVSARYGIAVVPELMKMIKAPNVVFRNIAADPVPQISMAFVYGSAPSPSAKLLIQHMQRYVLRNGDKGAAPSHNHDRIMIPSALVIRHPNQGEEMSQR